MLRCAGCGRKLSMDENVIEVERNLLYCPDLCALTTTVASLVEHTAQPENILA